MNGVDDGAGVYFHRPTEQDLDLDRVFELLIQDHQNGRANRVLLFSERVFPECRAGAVAAFARRRGECRVSAQRFYTMHDWLEIADYREEDAAHAILLLMLVALEEGSLCIEIAEPALLQRLRDLVPETEAAVWHGASNNRFHNTATAS